MKLKFITAIAFGAMAIISCDEDTSTIGDSLTGNNDKLAVTTRNFDIFTQSARVDSVFSRERMCYFGNVKDPETDTYVKCEFTTQFNMMESALSDLPSKENMLSLNKQGEIIADSCIVYVQFDTSDYYGDTLAAVKMRMSELDAPITSDNMHYTNFDPKSMIRKDGLKKHVMFSMTDLTMNDSLSAYRWVRIKLDDPYTDKSGKTYEEGYGAYLLRTFYDHPEYYKNTYAFVNKVCPGFFFELLDGVGVMARVSQIDMYTYYHYNDNGTTYYTYLRTTSTEEVVQTMKITNDKEAIDDLIASDDDCTFLKTPAGIFTEVTLPVDEICTSHPTDSLLSAKVSFSRRNNKFDASNFAFSAPSKLLLIEKDSIDTFFSNPSVYNNTYAFETGIESNAYTYSNISNMITRMYKAKEEGLHGSKAKNISPDPNWIEKHPNWNKAMLIPVEDVTITSQSTNNSYYYYNYNTTTTSSIIAINNQMGLSSTRLIRGTQDNPIKVEVIYAKFRE